MNFKKSIITTLFISLIIFQQVFTVNTKEKSSTLKLSNVKSQEQEIEQYTNTVLGFLENINNLINQIPIIIGSTKQTNPISYLGIVYKYFPNKMNKDTISAFYTLKKNNGFDRIAYAVILLFVEIISNASKLKLERLNTNNNFDVQINDSKNKINQKINLIKQTAIDTLKKYNFQIHNSNKTPQNTIKSFVKTIINKFKELVTEKHVTTEIENSLRSTLSPEDINNFTKLYSVATSVPKTTLIQFLEDLKKNAGLNASTTNSFKGITNIF